LPYWNYTDSNPDNHILPQQFRLPNDPVWGPLFRPHRIAEVNQGTPVDAVSGSTPMTLDAMMSTSYGDSGSDAGFCANVDGNPHGALHVNVGNDRGMGQVPWAANDPIFWLHHCNIDRIWASWAKAGGKNLDDRTFKSTTFRFADSHGNGVQAKVADILELNGLDYEYDRYLDRPAGSPPFSAPVAALAVHAISRQVSGPVTVRARQALLWPRKRSQASCRAAPTVLRPKFRLPAQTVFFISGSMIPCPPRLAPDTTSI
jgi:tyrosinase